MSWTGQDHLLIRSMIVASAGAPQSIIPVLCKLHLDLDGVSKNVRNAYSLPRAIDFDVLHVVDSEPAIRRHFSTHHLRSRTLRRTADQINTSIRHIL